MSGRALAVFEQCVGHQVPIPLAPQLPHLHHRGLHRQMAFQCLLDLSQLYAKTPQFHLIVEAAQVLDGSVVIASYLIPCPIEAAPRLLAEGIGNEPFRGQARSVQIALGDPFSAQQQFP